MFYSNYVSPSLSLTFILFSYLFSFCTANSQKYSNLPRVEDIPHLVNSLQEGLVYVKNNNDTKTLDVALGIMLVKGSLQWMEIRLREGFSLEAKFFRKIIELLELSRRIFLEMYRMFRVSENQRDKKFSDLLRHVFDDVTAEDLKYGSLMKNMGQFPIFENCSFVTDYTLKGSPNDSDSCIIELFDKLCNISSSCWFEETNSLENTGYKTSHRLLYLQLMTKLKCGNGDEGRIKTMKMTMCQQMLEEAIALYGMNDFFARDLFLEQIALCGFDGYTEFADRDWSIKIPRWQHSEGCFGVLRGESFPGETCSDWQSDLSQRRRDDPCSAHITAVAISAIAFHLRVAFDQL